MSSQKYLLIRFGVPRFVWVFYALILVLKGGLFIIVLGVVCGLAYFLGIGVFIIFMVIFVPMGGFILVNLGRFIWFSWVFLRFDYFFQFIGAILY